MTPEDSTKPKDGVSLGLLSPKGGESFMLGDSLHAKATAVGNDKGTINAVEVFLENPDVVHGGREIVKIFGARIVLTEGPKGMNGAIKKATEIRDADPLRYFLPQQFENPANPAIHESTTGPEIWEDTDGQIDILVSGVGTGGTITGVSRYIKKQKGKAILSVAVEPRESPVISQWLAKQEIKPAPHKIQGIGAGFIPKALDLSIVDRVEQVNSDDSIAFARRLASEEGILSGVSSGAAVAVAARLAALPEFSGKTIVVVLPDSGERYLTGPLFEGTLAGVAEAKAGDTI